MDQGEIMKRVGCGFALSLFFVSPLLAAPPLASYKVDIHQTSVSGVSSGGAMAVQMHVAHSSIMRGVGVIAGVAYDCTNSALLSVEARFARAPDCMNGSFAAAFSIGRTTVAAGVAGAIDDPATNLPRQKVWLFSGYNDGLVRRGAMNAVATYYKHYVSIGNVFYKNNNQASHALITDNYGGPCLSFTQNWINNCNYDAAGRLLEHIYGHLNQRVGSSALSSSPQEFDQREFVTGGNPELVGLADTGYVYVPAACKTQTCRVHVVFHGCLQNSGTVDDAVAAHAGYNEWADANNLIVLYPQTVTTVLPFNPNGCWDWWGLSDLLPLNADFARKTGYQISAVRAMLDRLADGFVPGGGSSDTFGTPQNFQAPDSSATSVDLVWQPNSAASGFNIYRSPSGAGPYTKINAQPVSGASFGDQKGLTRNTNYYYKISAVDASNHESAMTSAVLKKTASKPPACVPYTGDNVTLTNVEHVAHTDSINTWANGSNENMGLFKPDVFSQLTKAAGKYHVRYCP